MMISVWGLDRIKNCVTIKRIAWQFLNEDVHDYWYPFLAFRMNKDQHAGGDVQQEYEHDDDAMFGIKEVRGNEEKLLERILGN